MKNLSPQGLESQGSRTNALNRFSCPMVVYVLYFMKWVAGVVVVELGEVEVSSAGEELWLDLMLHWRAVAYVCVCVCVCVCV